MLDVSRHYSVSKDHENQMGDDEVRFTAYIRHVLQCCQLHFGRLFNFSLLFYFPFVYASVHTEQWMDANEPLLMKVFKMETGNSSIPWRSLGQR
jgi:hypothetical protein